VLAAVAMAVYSTGVVDLPNLDKVLEDVGRALGTWTYLLVGVLAYAEAAAFLGLVIPGETAIIVAGVVAGQGEIDIVALIALVWACSVAGDLTGLLLGRRLGRPFLLRHGPRVGVSEDRVHQVDRFFERHGGKAVFLARFVGLARALSPFLAGSSGMPLRRFLPYDVLGAGIQSTILCLVGYVFWHSLDQVLAIAKKGALALGLTITVVVALVVAVRWIRVPENRGRIDAWLDAHAGNPAVRLLLATGRLARGPARFLWARLTPGNLGLELTTLLALGLVGGYAFFGYLIVLDESVHTMGDRRAVIWADAVQAGVLDHLADAAEHLASLPVVAVAIGVLSAGLLAMRERLEAVVLAGGLVLAVVAVELFDGAVARAAPSGTEPVDYPDGSAAYAVAWIALAVALRRVGPRSAKAALAVLGTVLTVAAALAPVYLRDEWFSNAAGGAGLGVLCFSLAGAVGVLTRAPRRHPRGEGRAHHRRGRRHRPRVRPDLRPRGCEARARRHRRGRLEGERQARRSAGRRGRHAGDGRHPA
jgi:membrane protein DedA with SNARE-associated domain